MAALLISLVRNCSTDIVRCSLLIETLNSVKPLLPPGNDTDKDEGMFLVRYVQACNILMGMY